MWVWGVSECGSGCVGVGVSVDASAGVSVLWPECRYGWVWCKEKLLLFTNIYQHPHFLCGCGYAGGRIWL